MKPPIVFGLLIIGLFLNACKEKTQPISSPEPMATPVSNTVTVGNYQIIPNLSSVKWIASKPTGTHDGTVPISAGNVKIEEGNITGGSIELDMTQIHVLNPEGDMGKNLEEHLKGTAAGKEEDFFNVNKFPKATFTITSTSKLDNDPEASHMINGNLTIKDITKPISFKARLEMKEPGLTISAAPFNIDRTEFNIRFKSKKFFDNLKDDYINDEFQIGFYIVATKKG